jgi:hypothetical protein
MRGQRNHPRVIAKSASSAVGHEHRSQAFPAQRVTVERSRDRCVDAPAIATAMPGSASATRVASFELDELSLREMQDGLNAGKYSSRSLGRIFRTWTSSATPS